MKNTYNSTAKTSTLLHFRCIPNFQYLFGSHFEPSFHDNSYPYITFISIFFFTESPVKTPLTPANSISQSAITPDGILYEQIRQQFQNQLQLQEHYQNLLQAQQDHEKQNGGSSRKETREELMQRHGFH